MAWVDSITNSIDMNLKQSEIVEDRAARCASVPRVAKSQTGLSDCIIKKRNPQEVRQKKIKLR